MSALDWAVLVVYLVAIIAFGLSSGRGNVKIDDFFLAGRQMPWWAVGLSVMATQISAITFICTTGQAYNDGMRRCRGRTDFGEDPLEEASRRTRSLTRSVCCGRCAVWRRSGSSADTSAGDFSQPMRVRRR